MAASGIALAMPTRSAYDRRMSDTEKPLRAELTEAINKVRRELEIPQAPSSIGGSPDSGSVIADLEKELKSLLEARADL